MNTIKIEYVENYAFLRLNRGRANAINAEMANELLDALTVLKTNEKVRGVILSGHGEFFSAGLDVVELYNYNEQQISDFWKLFSKLARRLVAFPKPLIAAITGHSPAGGCVLALGCDYRVMATGTYRIGLNEIPFGIVVPDTIYNLYGFVIGMGKAYEYLLEGKLLTPEEALACNLVNEITSLEEVENKAIEKLKVYMKLNQNVWTQSKLNFRTDLLQRLNPDFESTFEATLKQWWAPETRAIIEHMIASLKKRD
ncbi:MAG: enoyl-CoA hydratase/isomerase family protein [Bacteroidia bacterium]